MPIDIVAPSVVNPPRPLVGMGRQSDRATYALARQRADNERYVQLVRDRKQKSERVFMAYYQRLARLYDRYRGIYSGKFAAFRNNIHIPFIYSVIQSDVARKVQMSLGNWPLMSFEGYAPEDEPIARKNELLVSVQFEDAKLYQKAIDFFLTTDLYGVGIMRDGWKRDIRRKRIRVPLPVAPGVTIDQVATTWQTFYDGPNCYVVDPLDFMPQPGMRFIDDMMYATERYWRDLDDMRAQVAAEIANGIPRDELSFDPAALDQVAATGTESDAGSRLIERLSIYRNQTDWEARKGDKYSKTVEVWDHWCALPDELVPPDGIRHRQLIVLNGRVLAKNAPNPNDNGEKPWTSYSIGDPHYFHGVGKSELLEKLQAAANRLMNHVLDVQDLTLSPVFLANSSIFPHQNLVTQPGRVFSIDGPVGDDVIRPIAIDRQGLQTAMPLVNLMWQYMQQGSGIVEDIVQGGQGQRQTAREFQGRQEAVMTRLMMESRIAEEMWLEPLANRFRMLNRQYLPLPKQMSILGSLARFNPITGSPLPPDLNPTITHEDLWPDYRARAVGANQTMMRSATQQNVMMLLQAMSANPPLMQLVNWVNFARQMFEVFGFRNVQELLVQLPQVGMGSQMMGVPPEAAATAMGSPETLDPSHIQSMMAAGGELGGLAAPF